LEQQPRYTLGKEEKLKSTKIIEQLFKEGRSFSVTPFRVIYILKQDGLPQLKTAFSVSKRYFKKASDRNRIKRLMREAWRLQKNELAKKVKDDARNFSVFLIFTGQELPVYELVFEKTTAIVKRLTKICNEAIIAHT
jgi:ribonuclease P protein component